MKKVLLQGVITVALFFITWFGLMQIEWTSVFKVNQVADKTEKELGEMFWDIFKKTEEEYKHPVVVNTVDSIVTRICDANKIDRKKIKLHLLRKDDVNAFALPDGHLVVFTGLIVRSENQQELCGVLGHELAHIQEKHVMRKLVNEVGLSVLISMANAGRGSETVTNAAKVLSSTAFDRGLEKAADIKAVDYLNAAQIDPKPFSDFLFKLSQDDDASAEYWTWLNTHPDSKDRSEYIVEYCKDKKGPFKNVVSDSTWSKVKEKLED